MKVQNLAELLSSNAYPGRGIVVGRSSDNENTVIAYFIMGRSANSRNRIFSVTEDGIQTEAADPSKLEDPSLIIYHPVRELPRVTIVTNGDQTDTIRNGIVDGLSWFDSLRTRCFEPDPPNYTPRISALCGLDGSYSLSILKSFDGNPNCNKRFYFEYDTPLAGMGHFIHTYMGDGSPLPSFEGEPETVFIEANDVDAWGNMIWENLNPDNKVSLYVSFINLATGKANTRIYNKFEKV